MVNNNLSFFKHQFRNLNFYSLPSSILFILRKRINFILYMTSLVALSLMAVI